MIPKQVRVKMTKAQMSQHIYELSKLSEYEWREIRLAMLKKYNVRIEVTKSIRKCFVNNRLVICLPYARVCMNEFRVALRAVLEALYAVQED